MDDAHPIDDPLAAARARVAYPADGPYFQSHSIGLAPTDARDALADLYLDPWAAARGDAWDAWLEGIARFRGNLAPLIGAAPDEICEQVNVSSALTKILFSLPERRGRRTIVLTEDDFPTIGNVLAQAARLGYRLAFLPGGPALADPGAWARAFKDDVHLVHVTHVYSNSALRPPVAEICRRAREAGAWSVVDVAQSAGAVPVDAHAWGADFLTGTSVKYLCGGPGAAFLWADPGRVDACKPIDVGWFSGTDPMAFDIRRFDYAPGAKRFAGGTPSVAPFVLAGASAARLGALGVARIYDHNQALIDTLASALPAHAFLSHTERGARGSAVLVKPRDLGAATGVLKDARVRHDVRAGGLRFSFHYYNTREEVQALAAILQDLV
ncbi:MAG: aminotransferase class V-fold PLP-dependent enzyme [Pseudomonadota bacterium]